MMNLIRTVLGLLLLLCVVVVPTHVVKAQKSTNEVRGQVTDERGGAIEGAVVTLISSDGTEKTGKSDQQGNYSLK